MKQSQLVFPTVFMALIALTLVFIGYIRGEGQHAQGLKAGLNSLVMIVPLITFAFIVSGMIQTLIPRDLIVHWVGEGSGFRGIMVGTLAGALTPGGPFVSLPLAAGLIRAGATVGPMVAFISGWLLLALTRLPLEVGILGWRITAIRYAVMFFMPPLAGILAQTLFSHVDLGLG